METVLTCCDAVADASCWHSGRGQWNLSRPAALPLVRAQEQPWTTAPARWAGIVACAALLAHSAHTPGTRRGMAKAADKAERQVDGASVAVPACGRRLRMAPLLR
jgi:hypothetical protein